MHKPFLLSVFAAGDTVVFAVCRNFCYARRAVAAIYIASPRPFVVLPISQFRLQISQRFYLLVCILPFYPIRPKARIFFLAWFGFPSVSRETDSSRFSRKKSRKYEKNFQKIDKILKTILTLPFCQSIIMVEKYIRKQRAHGMCKK